MKKITKIGLIAIFFSAYIYQTIKYAKANKGKSNQKPKNYMQDKLIKFAKSQILRDTFDYPVRTLPATRRDSSTFLKACYLAAGISRDDIPEVFHANKDIALNSDGGYDFNSIPVSAFIQYRDKDGDGDITYYYGLYIGKDQVIMPNEMGVIHKYKLRDTYHSHEDIVGYGIIDSLAIAKSVEGHFNDNSDEESSDTGAETL